MGGGIHSSNYVEMPYWTLSTCGQARARRRQERRKRRYAVLPGDVGRSRPRERQEEGDLGIAGVKGTPSIWGWQDQVLAAMGKMNAADPLPQRGRTSQETGKSNPDWLWGRSPPSPGDGEPGSGNDRGIAYMMGFAGPDCYSDGEEVCSRSAAIEESVK